MASTASGLRSVIPNSLSFASASKFFALFLSFAMINSLLNAYVPINARHFTEFVFKLIVPKQSFLRLF